MYLSVTYKHVCRTKSYTFDFYTAFLIISWLSELKDMNFDFDMALIMIFNYKPFY